MTFELKEPLQLQLRTVRKPKFEVFDFNRLAVFAIDSGTFALKNVKTGALVVSGELTANNADRNDTKTIQATLELNQTDMDAGWYQLSMKVLFSNGESDVFRVPIELVDYEEVT
jgi:hypothetical protein